MAEDKDAEMLVFAATESRQSNRDVLHRSPARSRIVASVGTPSRVPREVCDASGGIFACWPMSLDTRDANDVVHRDVSIPPAVQIVLDTPFVQRLIELKQLGCAFNAYPCCTHTRKSHSLGVMELCGRFASSLRQKQPQLEISDKDILCLRIAGLCHDLGHGPYSHGYEAFLRAVIKNEKENPEQYRARNEKFKKEFGVEMLELPEKYEHEKTSLMMVDCSLARIGLKIDWDNLDRPLKQIGDGIDSEKFGVDLGHGKFRHFTSRDWVFIKECIYGAPLDEPDAPVKQRTFVGRETTFNGREANKEFLYDIVNNRHNGLDVDKLDYYDRDSVHAYGSNQGNLNIFLRDAVVAKGRCPNYKNGKCFRCRDLAEPGTHLMICYPKKHVSSAMNFFATRMKNHENVYTHKTTKAAEFQMIDLLLEADKHYCMLLSTQLDDPHGFPLPPRFHGFAFKRLPISRAWMYPRLFLRVDDDVIKIVEDRAIENLSPALNTLRQLLNDRRDRRLYKCFGEEEIRIDGDESEAEETLGDELWKMSEDELKEDILGFQGHYTGHDGDTITLDPEDIIVEKRTLHHGRYQENPVSQMRFLASKVDQTFLLNQAKKLPLAVEVKNLPMNAPRSFLRRTIRVFCRKPEKQELATLTFESWIINRKEEPKSVCSLKTFIAPQPLTQEEDDVNEGECMEPDSQPLTQDESMTQDAYSLPSSRKRKEHGGNPKPMSGAAKRLAY